MDKFLKSKAFWTGVVTIGFGIYQMTQNNADVGLQSILAGIGLIFLRNGVAKLEPKAEPPKQE